MGDAFFSKYINNADRVIRNLLSSSDIMAEEKRQCVVAFLDSLYKNSFTDDMYSPINNIITIASAEFIDKVYCEIECKNVLSKDDVDLARRLCVRQTNNFGYINDNCISVSSIRFDQPTVFVDTVVARYSSQQLYEQTKSIDDEISLILNNESDYAVAITSLSNEECVSLNKLLNSLDSAVEECRNRGIDISSIRNKDTKEIRCLIEAYQKEKQEHDEATRKIDKLDSFIRMQERGNDYKNSIDELIASCDDLYELLNQCKKNNWEIGTLYCKKPTEYRKKYLHYREMMLVDNELVVLMSSDKTHEEKRITNLCVKQIEHIRTCRSKRWKVPELLVSDPGSVIAMNNEAAARKKHKRNVKIAFAFSGIALAFFVLLGLAISIKYNLQHTKFPFSPDSVVGQNYIEIVEELEDAGYTDVNAVPSVEGIQEPGSVISIGVENVDSVRAGTNYRNDAEITVYYSCEDREDVTNLLEKSSNLGYLRAYNEFLHYGFDASLVEEYSTDVNNNYQISSFVLNDVQYAGGECYIPSGSVVELHYYGLAISAYAYSASLIGDNYIEVYEQLSESGFDNIWFVRSDDLITGWITEDGSIYDITINGESFSEGDVYFHGDQVIIYVNTFQNHSYQYIDY